PPPNVSPTAPDLRLESPPPQHSSGWGKNITSSIPSVQLLLPPSWRRRLRANGANNKGCRKSTARWIARSKATSSMSESCLLARALSMNDNVSSQPYNRRDKETAVTSADAAGAAVRHKSAPAPRLAELTDLVEEQSPQPLKELQQQQQQQQQPHSEDHLEETPRSIRAPPSALPTPFRFGDRTQLQQSPPPAPLWTAPRPPLSREQQRQQLSNATALLARCSSTRSAKENCLSSWSTSSPGFSSPSQSPPSLPQPQMMVINRLASSGSSIFEEDGDDSKKTKFLNPYVRCLVPHPRASAAAVAATAAPPARPAGA
ncbi:unnamed protein product, partial [Hapterophycus canaliculatus]